VTQREIDDKFAAASVSSEDRKVRKGRGKVKREVEIQSRTERGVAENKRELACILSSVGILSTIS
jgi:hypothetical protein